jgi:hypothetical protein
MPTIRPRAKVSRTRQPAVRARAADAGADALPFAPGQGQGVFLIISDIHFDPFADPAIVEELVAADVDAWREIFERSRQKGVRSPGRSAPIRRSARSTSSSTR